MATVCWLWTGATSEGYGHIGIRSEGGRFVTHLTHRVAFSEVVGPIPDGLEVDHVCRRRECVRPTHLQLLVRGDNVRRRRFERRTHCPKGHELAGDNAPPPGSNACRTCRLESYRRHRRGETRPRPTDTCPQGHPWTEANTYLAPDGRRQCRTCNNERKRRARSRHR